MIRGEAGDIIDALRKEHDEMTAAVIGAHVTLAGPCDTALALEEIAAVMNRAAANTKPFKITIANVGTFLPVSPTSFLKTEPQARLKALHNDLVAQLRWEEAFPYHPHVTITEYLSPAETAEVVRRLNTFDIEVTDTLDTIALLEKGSDGKWMPLHESRLRETHFLSEE
jgi:2'-5' RNA ligase